MSIFVENCFIELNNSKTNVIDLFPQNESYEFGILKVKMIKKDITKNPVSVLFTIDRSGSMSDTCSDGKTKLQHVKYTLKKIFEELSKKNCDIEVCVLLFDNESDILIDFVKINDTVLPGLVSKIEKISENGSTNISMALQKAEIIISNKNKRKCYHVFMTDGEVTDGESKPEKIAEMVDNNITNIFVGFGKDHDSHLLRKLCKNGQNNEYKFIDQIEKSGIVYGEIIHNILYCLIENPVLSINNGEIYDWKTNKWVEKLFIQDLVSESEKTFHIRTKTPELIDGKLKTKINQERELDIMKIYSLPILIENETNELVVNNMIPYMFRQKTQQLMYMAIETMEKEQIEKKQYSKNVFSLSQDINEYDFDICYQPKPKNIPKLNRKKENMKKEIKDFIKFMISYTKENQEPEYNSMIKLLCDDLYICYKTFDTNKGFMYTASRQSSQGNQTVCRATQISNDDYDECEEDGDDNNLFKQFRLNENILDTPYCSRSASETIHLFSQPL